MQLDALSALDPARTQHEPDPRPAGLPVRWSTEESLDESSAGGGAGNVVSAQGGEELNAQEARPDAMGQGWVTPPGGERVDALFVLAGTSLGIGRTERIAAPVWLALADLVSLDAIGDPTDGLTEVEIGMADGTVIGAGWTDDFVSAVVECLRAGAESRAEEAAPSAAEPVVDEPEAATEDTPVPGSPDVRFDEVGAADRFAEPQTPDPHTPGSPFAAPQTPAVPSPDSQFPEPQSSDPDGGIFSAQPVVRNRSRRTESHGTSVDELSVDETPPESGAGAPEVPVAASMFGTGTVDQTPPVATPVLPIAEPTDPAPPTSAPVGDAVDRSGALELEDVVYLGGYPGQTRKRKKCTAVLTHGGLEVAGPGDLRFRIAWDVVKTIETQNSDEARFRMNTKIHGDSSALVVECDQGVTILLEARDCPTIPLRSAIAQLLSDLPVLVV